jgi:DNA-binding YbaB/EbfC family protein
MVNMMKLMKQAANLQKDMEKAQSELAEKTVEFTSGGGMVTATAKGDMTIASIKIDPEVVDPEDVEMLEDMVVAAVDGALKAAKEMSAEAMGKLTGGMGLPGMPGM